MPALVCVGLIHASIVKPPFVPTSSEAEGAMSTSSFTPSNVIDCPTLPAANPGLPTSVPLLRPRKSAPSPSKRHQATTPEGTGAHTGEVTVKVADSLWLVPNRFDATTR